MGIILNPSNDNTFADIVRARDNGVFVDKTQFIEEVIGRFNTTGKFLAVTRPRRFGKTITAHMLSAFFSKGCDSIEMFEGLKISESPKYQEHLNRYDVIYWDMNSIRDNFIDYIDDVGLHIDGIDDIVDYMQYVTLYEVKQHEQFNEIINSAPLIGKKSLKQALSVTKNKFVLIMDEWDLIYREYRDDTVLQKKFIDLLRSLFKSDDGQSCFHFVYLTGILPIKKYNSQSALNNFKEYNMLSPEPYEKYFGFTEDEVAKIVESSYCSLTHEELKTWYEGYKLNMVDIYNPNSVASAVSDKKCKSYWSSTSSNKEVVRLINMNFDGIKNDILNLIAGAKIMFDYETFQNDMVSIENKDQLFSLLVCLGYLGCEEKGNGSTCRLAFVPNREIRSALSSIVRKQSWYNSLPIIERSEKLFHAIKNCDAGTVSQIIGDIHNSTYISVLGYNREEALVFCLIAGLMWSTGSDYECYREVQSGIGFVDLVYVPLSNVDLPIMLIEFKRDAGADVAIKQIKDNNYVSRYCNNKPDHEIIMIGLSYNSKNKEHDCVIESLTH